jgi:hypothetical protein
MLGLHMIIHSIMAGFAVFLIALPVLDVNQGFRMVLTFLAIAALAFHLVTLTIELTTTHTTDDAHRTVKMITSGEFSRKFWLGMILAGNVVPLLLLFLGNSDSLLLLFSVKAWMVVLLKVLPGVLILTGLWFAEDIWVKAPQRIPLS